MIAPLRERIRETIGAAILTAAEEVFAEDGLHAAHMGEIARRAGVAVGTLYNHFADREAMLAGLLEGRQQELLSLVDERLATLQGAPFEARVRGLLMAILEHAQAHRRFFSIVFQGETGRYKGMFPNACGKPMQTMLELLSRAEGLVQQGVAEGRVRADQAERAAPLLIGMVRALCMRSCFRQGPENLQSEVDPLLDFFLHGAAPR